MPAAVRALTISSSAEIAVDHGDLGPLDPPAVGLSAGNRPAGIERVARAVGLEVREREDPVPGDQRGHPRHPLRRRRGAAEHCPRRARPTRNRARPPARAPAPPSPASSRRRRRRTRRPPRRRGGPSGLARPSPARSLGSSRPRWRWCAGDARNRIGPPRSRRRCRPAAAARRSGRNPCPFHSPSTALATMFFWISFDPPKIETLRMVK